LSILFDPPSHAIYEKADTVEAANKSVELVDCLPMGNAALVSLVKPRGIEDIERGFANGSFIALMFKSAPNKAAGHFCNGFAYDHVHDGTFSGTRLAEKNNIVLNTKVNSVDFDKAGLIPWAYW
jgi:hypothetical protein